MDNLYKEINKLFKKYPHTQSVMEFKDELTSNLEEKVQDLIMDGYSEEQAIKMAIDDVKDFSIEGTLEYSKMKYKRLTSQLALIYSLIGLILSIPLMVYEFGRSFNVFMFIITLGLAVRYIGFKTSMDMNEKIIVNINKMRQVKKLVWLLWFVAIAVTFGMNTAVQFGSNIWFGTPIKLNGPYALGSLLAKYYIPLITILVPLYYQQLIKETLNFRGESTDEY